MKYLLIISCLLFTTVGWSKDVDWFDIVISGKDGLYYEKFTDVPFTGNVTGFAEGKVVKGIPEGVWLGFYESGELNYKGALKGDKRQGEWLRYSKNGTLSSKENYIKGSIQSEVRFKYYDKGQLKVKGNYNKKGILHGEYLSYYESGELQSKGNNKDGKKEGEWLWYYPNGELEIKGSYKEGIDIN